MFWIGRVSCLTLFGSEFLHSSVVVDSCFSFFVVVVAVVYEQHTGTIRS